MRKKLVFAGASALAVMLLLTGGAVEAADENAAPQEIDDSRMAADRGAFNAGAAEEMKNLKAEAGKIGPLLHGLYLEQTAPQRGEAVRKSGDRLSAVPLPVKDGLVLIDAIAAGSAQHLLADLEAMGLQNGSSYGRVVSGRMPVERLGDLNTMGNLVSAAPSLNSQNVGLVTTQGDVAQASDVARSTFGVDGSGVTVGTLSDSFDCTGWGGGAAADVGSGDLPAGIVVLADFGGGCIDEGRAMMQLIHDVAPGSSQAFHTALDGVAGFANGIIALQQVAGADIIVDDVIYFAEPMFQDGPLAQAAQIVADNGSAYFSSAGNQSFNSWETTDGFVGSGVFFGGELHDFDPGPGVDIFQEFVLLPGTTFFSFQWDQPYASAGSPTGSASDLDIYLFVSGGFSGLGGSLINFGGDPVEVFGVGLGGTQPLVVQIAIANYGGPAANIMKYVTFGSDQRFGGGPIEYVTNSSTSYGHSNAANMAGVGAAAFFNTAAFSPGVCEPACINSFSALGGVPILFDLADNPINEVRQRPNFVGPDGGNTTFFGADLSFPVPGTDEPDGFGNFFGTSASAPHAAAGAALIKQTNPSLSPGEIYAILEGTATDMVPIELSGGTANPGSGPGFDFRTGFGFINVDLAVDAAATDPRNAKKRFVCHKNRKTLSVNKNAVPAHLGHGDKFGPCE